MEVRFENFVSVWDDQIPMLLINLVNTAVSARNEGEFKTAVQQLSENTDFDKFFAYGYGRSHFWLKQRYMTNADGVLPGRIAIVAF